MGDSKQILGNVFNIQKFSVHDGPGIRDIVFMKGCPLKCQWCSNPESQSPYSEVAYIENRCIKTEQCGFCIESCPQKAITLNEQGLITINRESCDNCGDCVVVCPAMALTLYGEMMSVQDVIDALQQESISWRTSGGVTISGGELLLQPDFVYNLLKECKKKGINTAIETSGFGNWDVLEKICKYTDLIYYDVKTMDENKHKSFIGVDNKLILENLKKMAENYPNTPIIVRTPVIPGVNDSKEDIMAIAQYIKGLTNLKDYELLAYHGFGEPKYKQLNKEYLLSDIEAMDKAYVAQLNMKARNFLQIS